MITIHPAQPVSAGNCNERSLNENPGSDTSQWSGAAPARPFSKGARNGSTSSRLFRFEAFAALQAVGFNKFLISHKRLLLFRQAADAAVGEMERLPIWRRPRAMAWRKLLSARSRD